MFDYGISENIDFCPNRSDRQKKSASKNRFTIDFDWIYGIIYLEGNLFKCLSLVDMRLIK